MNSRTLKISSLLTLLMAGSLFAFSNCTAGFTVDKAQKQSLLSRSSVFGNSTTATGTGDGQPPEEVCYVNGDPTVCPSPTPTPNPTATPTPNPSPTPTPQPTPFPPTPPVVVDVDLYCTQQGAASVGYTLRSAPSNLYYSFVDNAGKTVCSYVEQGARERIMNESRITLTDLPNRCPNLASGQYTMKVGRTANDKSVLTTVDLLGVADWAGMSYKVNVTRTTVGAVTMTSVDVPPCQDPDTITIAQFIGPQACLALFGSKVPKVILEAVTIEEDPGRLAASGCAASASPLVIQLPTAGQPPAPIQLTPPLEGVEFDILGVNSFPRPYVPRQISWFIGESAKSNYFLVLPDARGRVHGINELFGDNTVGPDGKTAANGYEALRKYDGRNEDGSDNPAARDGYITASDAVFNSLRLWADANRDGVAQVEELSTLDSHNLTLIDLNYDPEFAERDQYGNETKMKSVVKTRDGQLHLMYDLWFRPL